LLRQSPNRVSCQDVTIRNNIITTANGNPLMVEIREAALIGPLTTSHNRYYYAAGTAQFSDQRKGSIYNGGLAGWQTHIGGDSNSSEGDPQLDTNYHLAADSPLIDAGFTVSSVTNDYDGGSRPSGAGYDIGADEYGAGTPLPVPPPPDTTGTGGGTSAASGESIETFSSLTSDLTAPLL